MKSSMWRSCFLRVLQDGEALAAHVLLRGRDPQIATVFTACPWNAASGSLSDRCRAWNSSCSMLLKCWIRTTVCA